MRIGLSKLNEIAKVVKSDDFEVGADERDVLTLRFGYWRRLRIDEFNKINNILAHRTLVENLVDEDDDCGELWNYKVEYKW